MTIARNIDGFSTVIASARHADYRRPLPFDYMELFEDFVAAASGVPAGWTHTNTSGSLALASLSYLTQTLGGSDNDLSQLYPTTAALTIATGKRAHFRWRGKVDKGSGGTEGEQEVYIGLSAVATGTGFIDAGGTALAVNDFIGFASYDGSANISCVCRDTDVESAESAATSYTDGTLLELAWDYDGTTVTFYKDTAQVAQINTNVPTAALTPMLYVKAGEANAAVLTTDYVWTAVER